MFADEERDVEEQPMEEPSDEGSIEEEEDTEAATVVMTGRETPADWRHGEGRKVDFFTLKATVHSLLSRVGIRKWEVDTPEHRNGYAFDLTYRIGDLSFVRFGKVANDLTDRFDIPQEVFYADFDLAMLLGLASRSVTVYEELNRFPAVVRDLAIVVGEETPFEDIQRVAIEAGGDILTRLEVFDIYKNEEHVGAGKMSVALRFTIENKQATLADKEIDQWFGHMQKTLSAKLGAEIRR